MWSWARRGGLAAWSWSLAIPLAWAQGPAHPAPAYAPNQVGVVAAVQGQVEVTKTGTAVGRIVESGEAMLLGDTVTTDAEERLQILLLDQTVFTIGPNSAIVIDEFVYDPATDAGKLSAEILKGTFRFVTGKIAHKNPESMTVKLPVGTIGVRGTMVVGNCEGQTSSVALIGPGAIIVSNDVAGAARQVSVTRTGFGTTIPGANIPPAPPSFVPPAELNAWAASLGFTPGFAGPQQGQQPGQPGQQPGQPGQQPTGPQQPGGPEGRFGPSPQGPFGPPGAEGRFGPGPEGQFGPEGFGHEGMMGPEGMMMQFGEGMFSPEGFGPEGMMGPEGFGPHEGFMGPEGFGHDMGFMPMFFGDFFGGDFFGDFFFFFFGTEPPPLFDPNQSQQSTTQQTEQIQDGITTFDQLRASQQTGHAHYIGSAPFTQTQKNFSSCINCTGTTTIRLEVDFGSRIIGTGPHSKLTVDSGPNGDINQTVDIPDILFTPGAASGNAILLPFASGALQNTEFKFENAGGIAGKHLDVAVRFNNGAGDVGSGDIADAPRTGGQLPPP